MVAPYDREGFKNKMKINESYVKGRLDERERIKKLIDDEKLLVNKVCLGLVHPPQEEHKEFTKWLQDSVIFHINQIKHKIEDLK